LPACSGSTGQKAAQIRTAQARLQPGWLLPRRLLAALFLLARQVAVAAQFAGEVAGFVLEVVALDAGQRVAVKGERQRLHLGVAAIALEAGAVVPAILMERIPD